MRISELMRGKTPFVSLEFFPPRDTLKWPDFFRSVGKLLTLRPLFVSVTYGAMGSTRVNTLEIVRRLKQEFGLETMAHLTCMGSSRASVDDFLDDLVTAGVDNVLALRGDPPREGMPAGAPRRDFRCAAALVAHIRERYPGLGIGVAAYPEGHPEAPSPEADLHFLKQKLDQGADFAITQFFFNNDLYWSFVGKARAAGIEKPIIPGILPIVNLDNVQRIISLSSAQTPEPLLRSLRRAQENGGADAVKRLGVGYATGQAQELLSGGAPGIHIYTLNRADTCLAIVSALRIEHDKTRKHG